VDAEQFARQSSTAEIQDRVRSLQEASNAAKGVLETLAADRERAAAAMGLTVSGAGYQSNTIAARLGVAPNNDELARYRSLTESYDTH